MRRSTSTISSIRSKGLDREEDRTKGYGSEALGNRNKLQTHIFFSFPPFVKASFPISLIFTFLLSLLPVLFDLALKIILLYIYPTTSNYSFRLCAMQNGNLDWSPQVKWLSRWASDDAYVKKWRQSGQNSRKTGWWCCLSCSSVVEHKPCLLRVPGFNSWLGCLGFFFVSAKASLPFPFLLSFPFSVSFPFGRTHKNLQHIGTFEHNVHSKITKNLTRKGRTSRVVWTTNN